MKYDLKSFVICVVVCVLFSFFWCNREKVYQRTDPFLNKYVWKYIPYSIGYPIIMFLILILVKQFERPEQDDVAKQLYLAGILSYLLITANVIFELMEKFGKYVGKIMSFPKLLIQIFLSLLSIVLCYGFAYNILYYYDNSMFSSVCYNDIIQETIQFVYYSCEIFFNTDVSDIRAINLISQGLTIVESLTSFLVIVILLANYKNIGNIFKNI